MKRPQKSRVNSGVQKLEPRSIETSIASIQSGNAPPADTSYTEGSIGSIEPEETDLNPEEHREGGSSISSIDPQNTSYYIQYHPELA